MNGVKLPFGIFPKGQMTRDGGLAAVLPARAET